MNQYSETANPSDLTRLFRPLRMAVIGAHDGKPLFDFMWRQLETRVMASGGEIFPVNPKLDTVFGHRSYPTLMEIPGHLDVVVILISDVFAAMQQVEEKRPSFVVVHATGFSEGGSEDGKAAEQRLLAMARKAGTRIVGPNTNVNMFEMLDETLPSKFGIVAQSGHQGRPLATAQKLGFGVSYWVTTGNEVDLGVADFVDFMAHDPSTHAIAGYVEGFHSGSDLRRAAEACIEERTPFVLVKVGTSDQGAAAALSHTGHLAGSNAVLDAFFEQYSIHRVHDLDELLEVTTVLARTTVIPPVDGVALTSASGGANAHLVDLLVSSGLSVPELSPSTQDALRTLIPGNLAVTNPVDNGGYSLLRGNGIAIVDAIMDDPNVGVLLLPVSAPTPAMRQPLIDMATHAVKRGDKPIVALALMPGTDDPVYQAVVQAGVPVVRNMRNAMSAVRALMRHPARVFPDGVAPQVSPDVLAAPSARSRALDEPEALAWLAEQGIKSVRHEFVPVGEDVVAAAERIGYPVVLKAVSPELLHKSERGGVKVGLGGGDEVRRAHREMAAALDDLPVRGYIVGAMIKGGVELLAGITRDPLLGPTVVIGSGGVAAEAMRDTSLSVLPFDRARAAQMVERLRVAPLLGEWRGRPTLDKEAVIDTLMTLQEIATRGQVVELDINPLLVQEHGAVMLDAVVILEGEEA